MRSNNNENPNLEKRSWNADDMRYMKNESPVTPVSYAARVAPLPEDRANAGGGMNVEMAEERRRFEGYKRRGVSLRYGRMDAVEEDAHLPFPQLIKVEKVEKKSEGEEKGKTEEKGRVVYDVKEAIRLVKVGFF